MDGPAPKRIVRCAAVLFVAIACCAHPLVTSAEVANWCTTLPLPRSASMSSADCRAATLKTPRSTLRVAVMTTAPLRGRGLMHVSHVPAGEGMLFVFPDELKRIGLWMKDTITPLDMIWIRHDGTVSKVAANVPVVSPNTPDKKIPKAHGTAQFLLELGAGEAARHGIRQGTLLSVPHIASDW